MKIKYVKSLLIIVLVTIQKFGTAQVLNYTGSPASAVISYNIGTSSLPGKPYPPHITSLSTSSSLWSFTPSTSNPGTATFIEFGDGNFSFDLNNAHTFNTSNIIYPITYKLTGVYDDDPRPPRHLMANPGGFSYVASSTATPPLTMLPVLTSSKSIGVMANINSVLASDTMIYVVTYRLKQNAASNPYIKFSYNNVDAFKVVDLTENITSGSLSTPFVRTHFGETVSISTLVTSVGYKQTIKIENLDADSLEHHIFITLIPKEGLTRESMPSSATTGKSGFETTSPVTTVNVLAELIDGSGTSIDTDIKKFPVEEKSHDPNYIEMYPRCLSLPKKIENIRFHIHCQNIGLGAAKQVKIKVGLPGGMKTSDIDKRSIDDNAPFGVKGVWDYSDLDSLEVKFDLTAFAPGMASLHTLNGIAGNPMFLNDTNTMADIWFTAQAGTTTPNLLVSAASIYFTNIDNTENAPVTTNFDFVQYSKCCNCKSTKDNCNGGKPKCRLWRWLFCKKC